MTNNELKSYRSLLEIRLAELQNGRGSREALAIEESPDEMDRIQHSSNRDYAMGNLERNFTLLGEVRDALSRIEAGAFGICTTCEEKISPKRLAAIPYASSCIACRQAEDLAPGAMHVMAA
jgi:DnaK suppressor protein